MEVKTPIKCIRNVADVYAAEMNIWISVKRCSRRKTIWYVDIVSMQVWM